MRARALARAAGALAEAGQYRQAEATARTITEPSWQAEALAQLAETLAKAGDSSFASRVAASACAVGRWTTAVRPVLILEPSASAAMEHLLASKKTDATVPKRG